ncbi:hypothetical protein EVAR_23556_1 [Eumeta japonica]|uniref:Uncharacterized protein n=1 Tax=Eumeta variegata TaxID=151549 RepID=A0A4C1WW46_EUMVA|nr:hypothetical protein EVAR_23556_1 [Eumeta japonica]
MYFNEESFRADVRPRGAGAGRQREGFPQFSAPAPASRRPNALSATPSPGPRPAPGGKGRSAEAAHVRAFPAVVIRLKARMKFQIFLSAGWDEWRKLVF